MDLDLELQPTPTSINADAFDVPGVLLRSDPDVLSRLGLGSLGIGFRALEEWSLTRNSVDDIESRLQIQLNVLFCVRVRVCVCVCVCSGATAEHSHSLDRAATQSASPNKVTLLDRKRT